MHTRPLPRVIAGAVVAMIAVAAFLTFTRGEAPATDTASATLPGVSNGSKPTVERSTPTPADPESDAAPERDEAAETKDPATTPATSAPTAAPTTPAPRPDPTDSPDPKPTPSPTRPAPCGLVGTLLGTCR